MQLAQFNTARAIAPLDDPRLAGFVAQIAEINALAEASPGFVWRLRADDGRSSSYVRADDDPNLLVNLSVWDSIDALHAYVYRSGHLRVFQRRREWFEPAREPGLVLWWIAPGHVPDLTEAQGRLRALRTDGPTPAAFTFAARFPPQ
jgi:hypothetical protein